MNILVDSLHTKFFFPFFLQLYVNALGTGAIYKTAYKNSWLLKSNFKFHSSYIPPVSLSPMHL